MKSWKTRVWPIKNEQAKYALSKNAKQTQSTLAKLLSWIAKTKQKKRSENGRKRKKTKETCVIESR